MKPLGTSILIGILKSLLTTRELKNISTKDELNKILDNCLKSQLIPQCEDLTTKKLELFSYFLAKNRLSGYHKKYIEDDSENSSDEFNIIADFIEAKNDLKPNVIRKAMKKEKLEDTQSLFQDYWVEKNTRPDIPKTIASIQEMLKARGVLEEEDYEDSTNEE